MEAVNHFQLTAEVLLCEVFEHSCIDKTLHEQTSILRQTKTWQPLVANPLMVHLTKRQVLHVTHTTLVSRQSTITEGNTRQDNDLSNNENITKYCQYYRIDLVITSPNSPLSVKTHFSTSK